jgi:muramoyltetrapeptide carboxypeptidase
MRFKYTIPFIFFSFLFSCSTYKNTNHQVNNSPKKPQTWVRPKTLHKGDTIAIVSPAGSLKDSIYTIKNALDSLTSWGLHYKIYEHVFDKYESFAGKDKDRADDFQRAIDDPSIKAVWCSRGGYGSVRMMDMLDYSNLIKNPKWIIGFSDITALHNDIHNNGIQSIHGIMPLSFRNPNPKRDDAIKTLKNIIFGIDNKYKIDSSPFNKTGVTTGVLVGGNLSLLESMLQSRSSINTDNKILFLEEIDEKDYKIDRMLYSLKRAGYFDHCNGVIIGGFTDIKDSKKIILDVLSDYDFPIVFNFPAGHVYDNKALIFGAKIKLKVTKKKVTLTFIE